MIPINAELSLPDEEIRFTFSRSSGPGGQNVNKLNTKATLWFDVANSPTLSSFQKLRIRQFLINRMNKDGVLQVSAEQHRTQKANKEEALQRFTDLLASALVERKPRKKSRITAAMRAKRLQMKNRRGVLKSLRRGRDWKSDREH